MADATTFETSLAQGRRTDRVRSFLRARILFNNGNASIDCIIRNISPMGAKLSLNSGVAVPAEFDLDIPQKSRTYRARIAWRDEEWAGVEFVTDREATAGSDLRIERLLQENNRLKQTVAQLTKRLEALGQAASFD